jgi:hypothetical protein
MRIIILFLSVLLFSGCYKIERDCGAFKTGNFYSEVAIDRSLYRSYFSRTEALQIETYQGRTDSSTVRWINDCEVIFSTINPKNRAEKKDIHLKILTTTDSSYTYEYSYVGESLKQKGIAFKAH